jgi:hypothetical protein
MTLHKTQDTEKQDCTSQSCSRCFPIHLRFGYVDCIILCLNVVSSLQEFDFIFFILSVLISMYIFPPEDGHKTETCSGY